MRDGQSAPSLQSGVAGAGAALAGPPSWIDLHELLGTEFTSHWPKDTGADRLLLVVQQDGGVAVEADDGTVGTTHAVLGANDHGSHDLALLHFAARNRFLDGDLDDVADAGVTAVGTAEHLDAHHTTRAAVVSDIEHGLSLNHIISPTPSP